MIDTYILDIIIVLALAILVITLGNRLKIPGVVGFLLTGMVVGPYGLCLIDCTDNRNENTELKKQDYIFKFIDFPSNHR